MLVQPDALVEEVALTASLKKLQRKLFAVVVVGVVIVVVVFACFACC